MANPLQKYYRQPKIYLSLPSKGKYYPPGCIQGDPENLPVFGMTAMDEIILKTPDALFSGESVVSIIKSCIPNILDPWKIPQTDVDSILIAIRTATYGQKLNTTFTCTSCGESNNFDLSLSGVLDYFSTLEFESSLVVGPLLINLRPLTYKEVTNINLKSYEYRRRLVNIEDLPDKEKDAIIDQAYKNLASLTIEAFQLSIQSVEVDDEVVDSAKDIQEWLKNSDKEFIDEIKKHTESVKKIWSIQPQKAICAECETENTVMFNIDNSDFFGLRS